MQAAAAVGQVDGDAMGGHDASGGLGTTMGSWMDMMLGSNHGSLLDGRLLRLLRHAG